MYAKFLPVTVIRMPPAGIPFATFNWKKTKLWLCFTTCIYNIIQIEEEIGNIVDISIEISRKEHKA